MEEICHGSGFVLRVYGFLPRPVLSLIFVCVDANVVTKLPRPCLPSPPFSSLSLS